VVNSTTDTITEKVGEGTDEVQSSVSFNLATASNYLDNLTLLEAAGASTGTGNIQDNIIFGNSFANTLNGGDGDDSLVGGAGNDCLDGGRGLNTLVGGGDDDIYVVESESEVIVENAGEGTDTVQAKSSYKLADGSNLENLFLVGSATDNLNGWGNSDNNYITGDAGANHLYGENGNDTFEGGAGNDTMVGGDGNDLYYYLSGDVIAENPSSDGSGGIADAVRTDVNNWTLSAEVEQLFLGSGTFNPTINGGVGGFTDTATISGNGNDGTHNLIGILSGNLLVGNYGDNTLSGGNANDTLYGADGDDSLFGGAGADSMVGGIGNDTYNVDNGSDIASETISGNAGGIDVVNATVNFNLFTNGTNVENLNLNTAGSTATVGTGNDLGNVITGNNLGDSLSGGDGRDTLNGGTGSDTLDGGALQDSLTGGAGNDALIGGTGDDFLIGTATGGIGAGELDTLTGGIGLPAGDGAADVFVLGDTAAAYYNTLAAAGDYALITDFTVADHDQLQMKTLPQMAAPTATNANGYVVGANIFGAAGAANSWVYRDVNNNAIADAPDNLIAAVQVTDGALDLTKSAYFV
jgi:Ca2+-binding RTX toxin-like protein